MRYSLPLLQNVIIQNAQRKENFKTMANKNTHRIRSHRSRRDYNTKNYYTSLFRVMYNEKQQNRIEEHMNRKLGILIADEVKE